MKMAGEETAAERFVRDWDSILDSRKVRGLDNQTAERASRLYVNAADGTTPADDDLVNPNP
jgi:hypothetical protein